MLDVDVTIVGDRDHAMAVAKLPMTAGHRVAVVTDGHEASSAGARLVELPGHVVNTVTHNGKTLVALSTGVRLRTSVLVPASILNPALFCTLG